MAISKEQKKSEGKKKEELKQQKKEKYEKLFAKFITVALIFLIMSVGWLVVEASLYTLIPIILFAISALLAIKFFSLSWKEEFKMKKSLINKLDKIKFKEIKLKESENVFFNAFLGNTTIEAKIHPDNDDIVTVRFCLDDDLGNPHVKSVPFSRNDLIEAINGVIESDNK